MRVAIDSGPLHSGHAVRGIGVNTKELIEALQKLSKKKKDFQVETVDFSTNNQQLATKNFDIIHYPAFHPFFLTLPDKKPRAKVVVTIHDLIQLIYPKHYPPGIGGRINLLKQKARLRFVDAVITISETSKKDIVRLLPVQSNKVHVVHLAPKGVFRPITSRKLLDGVKKKYNLPKQFVLYVGDINYNKNIPALIRACNEASLPLIVVGKQAKEIENMGVDIRHIEGPMDALRFVLGIPHPELAHYKQILGEFKNSKNIFRLGFVPDADLAAIFNLATVYCQLSFYEGFGLPVVEAMACGCPVVVSSSNALVEIAGKAAVAVNVNAPNRIAKTIIKIANNENLREELSKKGLAKASEYNWNRTAENVFEVYKDIM